MGMKRQEVPQRCATLLPPLECRSDTAHEYLINNEAFAIALSVEF